MKSYSGFAKVYDLFMEDIPYDQWCARTAGILRSHGINDGLVLDLGCGTGNMSECMADAGYDMIGVDASEDMLAEAMEKRGGRNILYLHQDMRGFELYGTVRAVICIFDSINYITEKEDLVQVFRLVNNYLDPDGLFLFDFNTPAEYAREERIAYTDECDGVYLIGRNDYEEESGINEHTVTFFVPEDDTGETYSKFEETHVQRAYRIAEMKEALAEAGMKFISAEDEQGCAADEKTRRCLMTARECGKAVG